MAISKDKKATLVADLTTLLNDSQMVVYAKYQGLTVAELQELRKFAREAGVKIKVVKNRLVKVAMKEIAAYKDTEVSGLTGQLLYALGSDPDFDAAKVLTKFAKTHDKMELIGGFNGEGATLSKEEITTLGNLPTKNELIAQVVDTLLSGINGIVSGLENRKDAPAPTAETAEAQASETTAGETAETTTSETAEATATTATATGESAEATTTTDSDKATE